MTIMPADCALCKAPAEHTCGGCNDIRYCSAECQQADCELHKLLCQTFEDFINQPHADTRRAIFFPENDAKPRFVWLDIDDGGDEQIPLFSELLGDDDPANGHLDLTEAGRGFGRRARHHLHVAFRDGFLVDGSKGNESLARVTGGKTHKLLRGPFIVYGMQRNDICVDLNTVDLRPITEAVVQYCENGEKDKSGVLFFDQPRASKPRKVKGVKIERKTGDETSKVPHFVELEVPAEHPIFQTGTLSPVAEKVGFSLLTWKYPRTTSTPRMAQFTKATHPAAYLHLSIDPDGTNSGTGNTAAWGEVPDLWRQYAGSVLVVRSDKQPVSAEMIKAFCNFCEDYVQNETDVAFSGLNDVSQALQEVAEIQEMVLNEVNEERWLNLYYEWLEEKGLDKDQISTALSKLVVADGIGPAQSPDSNDKADDSDLELDDDYETSEENEEVSGEDSLELEGAAAELHGTEADVEA